MIRPVKREAENNVHTEEEPLKKKPLEIFAADKKLSRASNIINPVGGFNKSPNTHKQRHVDKICTEKSSASNKFNNKSNKFAIRPSNHNNTDNEKNNWQKFKKEKKELKLKRKKAKGSYEITLEAKQIYEKLKCRRSEHKSELVKELYNIFSSGDGIIKKIVMAHDTARILQCMLKFASPGVRDELSEKLLPHVVEMSQSKYSHFCVLRMFRYGSPAIKTKLVNSLFGHIVKLACHTVSSKILDHIYLSVANGQQKIHMRQEFYGELYRKSKDDNVKELGDTYKNSSNMKSSIIGAVKSNLEHVANKQLVDSALVHAVMLEYLQACDDDKMEETISFFVSHVPLMLTTREGSQAAITCFYKSTSKNRRAIIKNIKDHLIKIATHEHGHVFLIALLNSLDDTKATKKAIYDNMHKDLQILAASHYGRRVIQWLISPADTNCFHPSFIQSIEEGLQYSKKDKYVRRKEIFEQIEEPIAEAMVLHPNFWLSNSHVGLLTADILKKLSFTKFVKVAEAICSTIAQTNWTVSVADESAADKNSKKKSHDVEAIIEAATKHRKMTQQQQLNASKDNSNLIEVSNDDDGVDHRALVEIVEKQVAGIEEAGMHIVLKKIIKNDKERSTKEDGNNSTFGSILVQQLNKDILACWLTVNRGCFILLNIVEQNTPEIGKKLKHLVEVNNLQELLKQQKSKGAQLLNKKLLGA